MISEDQKLRYGELLKERKAIFKKSMKQMKRLRLICFLIGIVIGLGIAAILILDDSIGSMDIEKFFLYFYGGLLLIVIFSIVQVVIHEAGHLAFGLMTGYKFLSFRIFSTIFYKKDGHIYRRKFSIKGTAGQCLLYPPVRREDGSFSFVLYNLGGGISNLIFSLPFAIPAILTENTIARTIYLAFLLAGILTAATNLIPLNYGGIQNDGLNLKCLLKNKYMQDTFYLQLKVNAELSDGKLITDYPPEVFVLPEGSNDNSMLTVYVSLLSYYQQLAFHNFEAAERILAALEEKISEYQPALLNTINAERLFFMVLRHNSIEEIASIFERSRLLLIIAKTSISIQRIRYVYENYLTEEEKKDIMTLIRKKPPKKWKELDREKAYRDFLKVAENYPNFGEAAMYVAIVEYIRNNPAMASE